jgi:tRNA(fMet)-specific endonuclease VapC
MRRGALSVLILDTDHLVELDRGSTPGATLRERLEAAKDPIATTIISAEEQFRGWLAQIHRLSDVHRQINAYDRLQRRIEFFAAWAVLPWTSEAADKFVQLRKLKIKVGTMDLKIAAITLTTGGILLSRNQVDFEKVPGLQVQDWTVATK